MLRFAVCDDDAEELQRIASLIKGYNDIHPNLEVMSRLFQSPRKLGAFIENDHDFFDVYLLDILMPELDGIHLGKIIQHECHAPTIFITSSKEYALDAYGVHALRYIIKPVHRRQLFEALDAAVKFVSEFTKVVQVKSQDGLTPISPADVAYIENRARAAHYLMADGKEVIGQTNRGKFEESVQSVVEENANFIHPHKSFYVNLHFVRALKADYLLMENGTKVPISRRNMAETKHIYLEYLSRSGGRA